MTPTETPVHQSGAWLGEDTEGTYLIRLYSDGRMTGERKMFATGLYTGEVELTAEPWDFGRVTS